MWVFTANHTPVARRNIQHRFNKTCSKHRVVSTKGDCPTGPGNEIRRTFILIWNLRNERNIFPNHAPRDHCWAPTTNGLEFNTGIFSFSCCWTFPRPATNAFRTAIFQLCENNILTLSSLHSYRFQLKFQDGRKLGLTTFGVLHVFIKFALTNPFHLKYVYNISIMRIAKAIWSPIFCLIIGSRIQSFNSSPSIHFKRLWRLLQSSDISLQLTFFQIAHFLSPHLCVHKLLKIS